MQDFEELIGSALSGLKELKPQTTPAELIQLDRKRRRARTRWEIATSIVSVAAIAGTVALILQPKSAIASLLESAEISNSQAAIHVHAVTENGQPADQEMWIFQDHFIRQMSHFVHVATIQGTSFNLDDRLPFGFSTQNEEWETELLRKRMTGKVDEALDRARKDPQGKVEVIRGVKAHAGVYDDYRITTPGCYQGVRTVDLYVDPTTRLMQFEDQQNVSPTAAPYANTTAIEYPDAKTASREAPSFPRVTRFLAENEIRKLFLVRLKTPEQSCVVGGIRVTLYGVLVRPTWDEKALTVDVITKGGAGSDIDQDRWVEIVQGLLSSEKRLSQSAVVPGQSHLLAPGENWVADGVHVCGPVKLGGDDFLVNPANETLALFPKTLTVRVPVWKSDASISLTSRASTTAGETFHPTRLVGYATFVTHRILSDGGDMNLDLFHLAPVRTKN